ncbi:heme peroxidase family protein [Coleofasciculus sp. FACHB-1120]|uniref:peroxidase family protein n=1 Tax=Coleofasciculus sp. FACHB-1120 TaxID=2692783 RepID=UPI0016880D80|nr:heme peroxidase family protein [Coleofasciculus sp. FACHB-1120]MBD2743383.1 peroxidase [Coleofasciculus sp. FACHB-1120]
MTRHGQLYLRDQVPPRSTAYDQGKFGRLFPSLPPFASDSKSVRERLMELGKPSGLMDAGDDLNATDPVPGSPSNTDNPNMTAGFTFLGQFLDHDMTFDSTSSLERQTDPESIENFRTPFLELDNVYGSGRAASPHLYDKTTGGIKFLIEKLGGEGSKDDLPRNSQNMALIGDPRNDENTIISQMQLAFLKFHNHVVDYVIDSGIKDPNDAFTEAQELVRWHYQWIIVHEFLPTTVGQDLVDDILKKGRRFYNWRNKPFIPVEFSVAAYRFGHSQVRPGYIANHGTQDMPEFRAPIFNFSLDPNLCDPDDLRGGKRAPRRFVDWDTFFDFKNGKVKPNKKIDPKLSSALFTLPFPAPGLPGQGEPIRSLAQRNLLRHLTFSLPSGQDVARAMEIDPLSPSELRDLKDLGFDKRTPLWFYILKEAELRAQGKTLGPVGGRIVAEVFIGLLQGDRKSYLRQCPKWKPILGHEHDFKMVDLLKFAGLSPSGTTEC